MRLAGLILTVVLVVGSAQAATYYVKNGGSDANTGLDTTDGGAWQHAEKACSTAVAGDTVYFCGGTYEENNEHGTWDGTFYPANSGTSSDTIFYLAHPDYDRPKIVGNDGVGSRFAVRMVGVDYIVFRGFEVTNGYRGIWIDACDNIIIDSCSSHHNGGDTEDSNEGGVFIGYSDPDRARNITVSACSLYTNYHGLVSDSTDDINTSGIHVYRCTDCVFDNNIIFGNDAAGAGIRIKWLCSTNVVSNNTIYDCYLGIVIGTQGNQHQVHHNLVYDIGDHGINLQHGIYPSPDSCFVYNNTTYNTGGSGIGVHPNGDFDSTNIFNNICINAHQGGDWYNITFEADNHPNLFTDYNCLWNSATDYCATWNGSHQANLTTYQGNSSQEAHSVQVYPVFVDSANNDFRISQSSPTSVKSGGRGGEWDSYMGYYDPGLSEAAANPSVRQRGALKIKGNAVQR